MKNPANTDKICVQFVILAAGKGTRMNEGRPSPIPKVLIPLNGKPMVSYILETLKNLPLKPETLNLIIGKPILVIGYKGNMVQKEFGDSCDYVWQRQRLGTGHAAKLSINYIAKSIRPQITNNKYAGDRLSSIESSIDDSFSNDLPADERITTNFSNDDKPEANNLVFILQGDDSAFYKPETIKKCIENHVKEKAVLSFVTTRLADVKDLGRVVRDKNKNVVGIVEKENMTPEIAKINEINCAAYLFNSDWGTKAVKKIKKHLKGGKEYPLPDIIKIALEEKKRVIAYEIPSSEWRGINSPEQLKLAENKLKS